MFSIGTLFKCSMFSRGLWLTYLWIMLQFISIPLITKIENITLQLISENITFLWLLLNHSFFISSLDSLNTVYIVIIFIILIIYRIKIAIFRKFFIFHYVSFPTWTSTTNTHEANPMKYKSQGICFTRTLSKKSTMKP